MPRIRTIKPEFWSSPGIEELEPRWRLLYIAMWQWADDFGRGTAEPRELAAFAFPREDISVGEIRRGLGGIRRTFDVDFYYVARRPFYSIPSWSLHQKVDARSKRSRYPAPEDGEPFDPLNGQVIGHSAASSTDPAGVSADPAGVSADSTPRNRGTGEQGNRDTHPPVVPPSRDDTSGGEHAASGGATPPAKAGPPDTGQGQLDVVDAEPVEAEIVEQKPAKQKRGSRLPEGWFPDESAVAAVRRRFPAVTQEWLAAEHEKFQDHWAAASGRTARKVDWNAAWRNWMRRSLERDPSGGTHVRGATSGPRTTEKMRGYAEAAARVKDRRRRDGAEPD